MQMDDFELWKYIKESSKETSLDDTFKESKWDEKR